MSILTEWAMEQGGALKTVQVFYQVYQRGGGGQAGCERAMRSRYMTWGRVRAVRVVDYCEGNITTLILFVLWYEYRHRRDVLVQHQGILLQEIQAITGVPGKALDVERCRELVKRGAAFRVVLVAFLTLVVVLLWLVAA